MPVTPIFSRAARAGGGGDGFDKTLARGEFAGDLVFSAARGVHQAQRAALAQVGLVGHKGVAHHFN